MSRSRSLVPGWGYSTIQLLVDHSTTTIILAAVQIVLTLVLGPINFFMFSLVSNVMFLVLYTLIYGYY